MKYREVVIFSGHTFKVPQNIQRIDHLATHGWQLRYGGTKLFSDHTTDGSGAAAALEAATKELVRRIATLPAPSRLQQRPNHNKSSALPVGISGPIVRQRRGGRVRDCSLAVLLPRFGESAKRVNVYIGTENTYTPERFEQALQRAVELREAAVEAYQKASTRAMRAAGKELKDTLRAGLVPTQAPKATKAAPAKAVTKPAAKVPAKVPAKAAAKGVSKAPARRAAAAR